jgi:asparagine synthase (glutamine-hydrolysing)
VPFLDHVLVEYTARIPSRFKTRGLTGKLILKQAVRDLLPPAILERRKMGFPTPWNAWLAGPEFARIESLLLEPRSLERGLFKPAVVARMFQEHAAHARDHSDRIWRLLNLEIWHRVFLDRDPALLGSRRSLASAAPVIPAAQ